MHEKKRHTVGPHTQCAEAARDFVTTPEGQKAISAASQQAQTMTKQFKEAQRVNPESLHKPITL